MNDRIKQLWSQAGGHYDSGNQHTWPQYTIDNPEKFVELIVRECAKFADKGNRGGTGELMKKHFGVEE